MTSVYACTVPAVARREECARLLAKHPNAIPVVVEPHTISGGTQGKGAASACDKLFFTALPSSATVADLQDSVAAMTGAPAKRQLTLSVLDQSASSDMAVLTAVEEGSGSRKSQVQHSKIHAGELMTPSACTTVGSLHELFRNRADGFLYVRFVGEQRMGGIIPECEIPHPAGMMQGMAMASLAGGK